MGTKSLLASAALFGELYNNNKDIYSVIAEFIRASIIFDNVRLFNVTECSDNLERNFGLRIPDAIISVCLKNRLVKDGEVTYQNGSYSVSTSLTNLNNIQAAYEDSMQEYEEIIRKLVSYVQSKLQIEIDDQKKLTLISSFNNYLLDPSNTWEYSDLISGFFVANENDEIFKDKLNRILEGLILYEGIKYTKELDTLGNWRGHLVVYLDTEHLFNATGFNGDLFKKIFLDFHKLVMEANKNKNNKGTITLKYFEEIGSEIDKFFYNAEEIVDRRIPFINPSKTAMVAIIKGCKSRSDVVNKKSFFKSELAKLKIEIEPFENYYENPQFNLESATLISELQSRFNQKQDNDWYSEVLRIFTKINYLRGGINKVGIEFVKAIFMTENRLIKNIASSDLIYPGKGEIPLATNIEFMTERLWFKLNKSFGKDAPFSFNIITRARIVLASQINIRITETYNQIKSEFQDGKKTEKETVFLVSDLINRSLTFEEVTFENVDDSLNFLNYNDILESSLREQSLREKNLKVKQLKIESLNLFKINQIKKEGKFSRNSSVFIYAFLFSIIIILPLIILIYFIYFFLEDGDTIIGVGLGLLGIFISIFSFGDPYKKLNAYIRNLAKNFYKKKLRNIQQKYKHP